MSDLAFLAFTFGVGFVAFANPCGFSVLFAYMTHFFSAKERGSSFATRIFGGVSAGVMATLGFITVFAIAGILIGLVSHSLASAIPYLDIALGVGLIVFAYWLHKGHFLNIHLPVKKVALHSERSFYNYGIVYALASFGCTLPLFLTVVVATLSNTGIFSGVQAFLAYSLGMGAAMTAVTIGLAMSKMWVIDRIRGLQPYMNNINIGVLVLVGLYLAIRNSLTLAGVLLPPGL